MSYFTNQTSALSQSKAPATTSAKASPPGVQRVASVNRTDANLAKKLAGSAKTTVSLGGFFQSPWVIGIGIGLGAYYLLRKR